MQNIPYRIIYSKRRTIALVIKQDGSLVARAPKRANVREIERFVEQKHLWIVRTVKRQKQKHSLLQKKQFIEGESFLYLGNSYKLLFQEGEQPQMFISRMVLLPHSAQENARELVVGWYKKRAKEILAERVALYAVQMGVVFRSINITSAEQQLGSCTKRKTLNFPWRLIIAPPLVIDYIVVHELSHVVHMNHSQRFWNTVTTTYPRYKEAKLWLKSHNHLLHI